MASLPAPLSHGPDAATPEQIQALVTRYRPRGPVELFLVRRLATQAARYHYFRLALRDLLAGAERHASLVLLGGEAAEPDFSGVPNGNGIEHALTDPASGAVDVGAAVAGTADGESAMRLASALADADPSGWSREVAPHELDILPAPLAGRSTIAGPIPIRRTVTYAPVPYRAGILRRQRDAAERQYHAALRDLRRLQLRRGMPAAHDEPALTRHGRAQ